MVVRAGVRTAVHFLRMVSDIRKQTMKYVVEFPSGEISIFGTGPAAFRRFEKTPGSNLFKLASGDLAVECFISMQKGWGAPSEPIHEAVQLEFDCEPNGDLLFRLSHYQPVVVQSPTLLNRINDQLPNDEERSFAKKTRKPKELRKESSIRIRVTEEQKAALTRVATLKGLGVSSWMLSVALREAQPERTVT